MSVPPPEVRMVVEKASECYSVRGNQTQVAGVPSTETALTTYVVNDSHDSSESNFIIIPVS